MQTNLYLEKGRAIAGNVDWLTRFPTRQFTQAHPNCRDRTNCMADVLEEIYDGGRSAFYQWYYLLAGKMFEEPTRSIEAFARAYMDLAVLEAAACGCAPTTGAVGPGGQPLSKPTSSGSSVGGSGGAVSSGGVVSSGGGVVPTTAPGGGGGGAPAPDLSPVPGSIPTLTIGGFGDDQCMPGTPGCFNVPVPAPTCPPGYMAGADGQCHPSGGDCTPGTPGCYGPPNPMQSSAPPTPQSGTQSSWGLLIGVAIVAGFLMSGKG